MGCRKRDDRNPAVLHTLFVFEGFVACNQDIESGRLGRLQELAVLQPGETCVLDGYRIELGQPAPQLVREILVKQATHLQDGLRSMLISESDEACYLIMRDGGIILADLLDRATQFPFLDDLIGRNTCTFDQRNASLFAGNAFHQITTSPIDLFGFAH